MPHWRYYQDWREVFRRSVMMGDSKSQEQRTSLDFTGAINTRDYASGDMGRKAEREADRKGKKDKKRKQQSVMLTEDLDRSANSTVERRKMTPGPVFNVTTSGLRLPILLLRQGLLLLVEGIDARYGLSESAGPQSSLHVEIKLSNREQPNRDRSADGYPSQDSVLDTDSSS
jgi:hypothetical protein